MRPWKSRGFLRWMFFQAPSKSKVSRPAPRELPNQETAPLTETEPQDDDNTGDEWFELAVAYSMPCDENVLEAQIIDFVESEYDEDEFTKHTQDEEWAKPVHMPESPGFIIPGMDEHEEEPEPISNETPSDASKSTLVMLLDKPSSSLFTDVLNKPDAQADDEQTVQQPQNIPEAPEDSPEEPQQSNETPTGPSGESPMQDDSVTRDWTTEYAVSNFGEGFTETAPLPASEDAPSEPEDTLEVQTPLLAAEDENLPISANTDTLACDTCGTAHTSEDLFCGSCGTRLVKPVSQEVSAYCGSCGTKNEHKMNFCGNCGYKLVRDNAASI